MKHYIKYIFYALLLSLLPIAATSCEDDLDFRSNVIGEGEAVISAEVTFKPMMPALTSRAPQGGTAGNVIKAISELWIVVFDSDGVPYGDGKYKISTWEEGENTDTSDDAVGDGEHQAETTATPKANFSFPINLPYGKYRIYAVANYNLTNTEITSEEQFKTSIQLDWDEVIVNNNQMFGYFTTENKSAGLQATDIIINNPQISLKAWLKRVVSKLTIVYDGSGLKDNVVVFIKKATIKDIPKTCLLGSENRPGNSQAAPDQADSKDGEDPSTVLIPEGDSIIYFEGEEPTDDEYTISNYEYAVSCGMEKPLGNHDEDSPNSLFFFENIQPDGKEGTITDKRQDVSGNNKEVSFPDGVHSENSAWKDGRKYGTYVEIEAYYRSIADGNRSSGKIIYRFMLGKNVTTSYAAERNYHYKLTMKFKGYANDVDFHIDYNVPTPSIHVQPYYISYLYNHSMMYPVTLHTGDAKVTKLQAEIIENHWFPEGAKGGKENSDVYYSDKIIDNPKDYQWHGFLSLRQAKSTVLNLSPGDGVNDKVSGAKDKNDDSKFGNRNYHYYYDNLRHSREYSEIPTVYNIEKEYYADKRDSDPKTDIIPEEYSEEHDIDDKYTAILERKPIIDDPDKEENVYTIHVPMYTRAKQLIKANGYTGNNPYVSYQRRAIVRFTATLDDNTTLTEEAPIIQVRRVVNPKGIYRSSGEIAKLKPFHVTMRILPSETDTEFEDLVSEGPWKAYVIAGNQNLVTLGTSVLNGRSSEISGKTGSKLDFMVNFTGNEGYAVIRVDYHNYTCNHLIFVRVGYDPMRLYDGDVAWHTLNLRTKNKEVETPVDEGSLFKYGNLEDPIDATSNVNPKNPWTLPPDETWWTDDPEDTKLNIAKDRVPDDESLVKDTQKLWSDITFADASKEEFLTETRKLGNDLSNTRIATLNDFYNLYQHEDIEMGYGVLYADNATECAKHINAVYGYRYDNTKYKEQECGMRGTFVYNKNYINNPNYAARNIFFPIGNSGYGFRRPRYHKQYLDQESKFYDKGGWLKYAARNTAYINDAIKNRPLFFDIWRRPGAIYWLGKPESKKLNEDDNSTEYLGWDFNYFTFDFYGYGRADIFNNSSYTGGLDSGAAFIRLVED